jgi:hypothetical protein
VQWCGVVPGVCILAPSLAPATIVICGGSCAHVPCHLQGVGSLIHVSALAADEFSISPWARSKVLCVPACVCACVCACVNVLSSVRSLCVCHPCPSLRALPRGCRGFVTRGIPVPVFVCHTCAPMWPACRVARVLFVVCFLSGCGGAGGACRGPWSHHCAPRGCVRCRGPLPEPVCTAVPGNQGGEGGEGHMPAALRTRPPLPCSLTCICCTCGLHPGPMQAPPHRSACPLVA